MGRAVRGVEKKVELRKAGEHSGAVWWGPSRGVAARDRMETEEVGTEDYICGKECWPSRSLPLAKEVCGMSSFHRAFSMKAITTTTITIHLKRKNTSKLMQEKPGRRPQQARSVTAHFLPVLQAPLSMTKTETLFSLKASVHVHSCCSRPPLTLGSSLWKRELAWPEPPGAPPWTRSRLRVWFSDPAGDSGETWSRSVLGQPWATCLGAGLDPHVPQGGWRPPCTQLLLTALRLRFFTSTGGRLQDGPEGFLSPWGVHPALSPGL